MRMVNQSWIPSGSEGKGSLERNTLKHVKRIPTFLSIPGIEGISFSAGLKLSSR
jgi:hypothetical protein